MIAAKNNILNLMISKSTTSISFNLTLIEMDKVLDLCLRNVDYVDDSFGIRQMKVIDETLLP